MKSLFLSTLALAALAAALLAQAPAFAQSVEDAAVAAVRDICLPASEGSLPARELAIKAGYSDMGRPPDVVTDYFPASAAGAAYRAPAGAPIIVASAVMPATPYSCVVFFLGDAPEMAARLKGLRGASEGYALQPSPSSDEHETLSLDAAGRGGNDKLLMLRQKDGNGGFVVAYKAGPATTGVR